MSPTRRTQQFAHEGPGWGGGGAAWYKHRVEVRPAAADQPVPLVTVCCTTYNHERFIAQALDGFLMQETTFPFEVIVHDDASTDRTPEIIKEYVERHGDVIVPILQSENQRSQGIKPMSTFILPAARGRYLAFCEGDDYWTDENKLQIMVDHLEANPECVACFHDYEVLYQEDAGSSALLVPRTKEAPRPYRAGATVTVEDVLLGRVVHLSTRVCRTDAMRSRPDWMDGIRPVKFGDWLNTLMLAYLGRFDHIPGAMSVYRRHAGGVWAGRPPEERLRDFESMLGAYDDLNITFGPSYSSAISRGRAKTKFLLAISLLKADRRKRARAAMAGQWWHLLRWRDARLPDLAYVATAIFTPRLNALLSRLHVAVRRLAALSSRQHTSSTTQLRKSADRC